MADDPVYTRTQVWEHLLANVLKGADDNDDTYRKAFQAAKVTKVSALMALELQDLKDITWNDGGATQQLAIGQVKHIMALIAMLVKLDSLDPATLMQLTEDDLDGFILSLHTATNSQGDGPEDDNGSFMSANDVPHTMLPRPLQLSSRKASRGTSLHSQYTEKGRHGRPGTESSLPLPKPKDWEMYLTLTMCLQPLMMMKSSSWNRSILLRCSPNASNSLKHQNLFSSSLDPKPTMMKGMPRSFILS